MQAGSSVRDYVFEAKIGEGGMGEVWRARHELLDRKVAVKVMAAHLMADPEFEARFIKEAQAQARLQHPNIIGATDFFREQGQYFLVMPLIEGQSLEEKLTANRGPLPVEEALRISTDVLAALDYAHQHAVIHRDVKPSNILLDHEGRAYLTDFGIALMMGVDRKTRTGVAVGTAHYMSPEQIRRPKSIDHRTDVYSFGCVLYEMLTGRAPFEAADSDEDTDYVIKEAHIHQTPEPVRNRNASVPENLEAIVLISLGKDPNERFVSCGEFARAIQNDRFNEPIPLPKRETIPTNTRPNITSPLNERSHRVPSTQTPVQHDQEFLIDVSKRKKFFLVYVALTVVAVVVLSQIFGPFRSWFYGEYGYRTWVGLTFDISESTLFAVVVGVAQWLILREHIEPSRWWIMAKVLQSLVSVVLWRATSSYLIAPGELWFARISVTAISGLVLWFFLSKHTKTGWLSFFAGPVVGAAIPLLRYIVQVVLEIPFYWVLGFILDTTNGATHSLLQALCFTRSKNLALRKQRRITA